MQKVADNVISGCNNRGLQSGAPISLFFRNRKVENSYRRRVQSRDPEISIKNPKFGRTTLITKLADSASPACALFSIISGLAGVPSASAGTGITGGSVGLSGIIAQTNRNLRRFEKAQLECNPTNVQNCQIIDSSGHSAAGTLNLNQVEPYSSNNDQKELLIDLGSNVLDGTRAGINLASTITGFIATPATTLASTILSVISGAFGAIGGSIIFGFKIHTIIQGNRQLRDVQNNLNDNFDKPPILKIIKNLKIQGIKDKIKRAKISAAIFGFVAGLGIWGIVFGGLSIGGITAAGLATAGAVPAIIFVTLLSLWGIYSLYQVIKNYKADKELYRNMTDKMENLEQLDQEIYTREELKKNLKKEYRNKISIVKYGNKILEVKYHNKLLRGENLNETLEEEYSNNMLIREYRNTILRTEYRNKILIEKCRAKDLLALHQERAAKVKELLSLQKKYLMSNPRAAVECLLHQLFSEKDSQTAKNIKNFLNSQNKNNDQFDNEFESLKRDWNVFISETNQFKIMKLRKQVIRRACNLIGMSY